MPAWLKMANIAWFRMALVNEPNGAKRRELEEKLAEVEADVKTELFGSAPAAGA
jgi:hypothetical protein